MDTKAILAKNIKALMHRHKEWKKPRQLAPHCRIGKREVGWRTIERVVNPSPSADADWWPQIDTIQAIADAFKVPIWMLFTPDFDPEHKTGGALPPPEVIALAERILANRDAMQDVFGTTPISDEEMEQNGWKAPVAIAGEPVAPAYRKKKKTPSRQLSIKTKTMKREALAAAAAALVIIATASKADDELFSFKNWKLGSAFSERQEHQKFLCSPSPPFADMGCLMLSYRDETIAGIPLKTLNLYYYDDELSAISISFGHLGFHSVLDALRARYGPPAEDKTAAIKTRGGVVLENRIVRWTTPKSYLEIERYSSNAVTSGIKIHLNDYSSKFAQRRNQDASKRAKDL